MPVPRTLTEAELLKKRFIDGDEELPVFNLRKKGQQRPVEAPGAESPNSSQTTNLPDPAVRGSKRSDHSSGHIHWRNHETEPETATAWRQDYNERLEKRLAELGDPGWKAIEDNLPEFTADQNRTIAAKECVARFLTSAEDPQRAIKKAWLDLHNAEPDRKDDAVARDARKLHGIVLSITPVLLGQKPLVDGEPTSTIDVFIAFQRSENALKMASMDPVCRTLARAEVVASIIDGGEVSYYPMAQVGDENLKQGTARSGLTGRLRVPLPPETGRTNYVQKYAEEVEKYCKYVLDPGKFARTAEDSVRAIAGKLPDTDIPRFLEERHDNRKARSFYIALPAPHSETVDDEEHLLVRIAVEIKSRLPHLRIIPVHDEVGTHGEEANAFNSVEEAMQNIPDSEQ